MPTLFQKRATTLGAYWTSPLSSPAVRHYIRGLATPATKTAAARTAWWETDRELRAFVRGLDGAAFTKAASIGGEQEQGFEQSFSSLAYAYLKDKSPRLIDFIVGFQLVDRNEDNTKAVGIFGFKVGDQWLYAPVFFLNGDLKGHELLYIKKQDAFVPMKENWVNYLISRKPHILGEGSRQTTRELGGILPNLHRISHTPGSYKYGSDGSGDAVKAAAWAHGALPAFFALATKKASALYARDGDLDFPAVVARPFAAALAPFGNKFDLRDMMNTLPLLKTAFDKAYRAYPLIKHGFDTFYGPDFFREAAERLKVESASILKSAESYITPPAGLTAARGRDDEDDRMPASPQKPYDVSLFDKPKKKEKNAGLTVYALDAAVDRDATAGMTINRPGLTDREREKLLNDTVLIKDNRTDTSIAYNTQTKIELANPTETGLYHVLERPGTFDDMVVIVSPHSGRGREDFALVLRKGSPRNWTNINCQNLWVKLSGDPTPADWRAYVDGLDGVGSLEPGGTYVAVHANGSGTCAFRVIDALGDGAYDVCWEDHVAYDALRTGGQRARRPQDWHAGYTAWHARVYVKDRKGSGLLSSNGELHIPDSYKVIRVAAPVKHHESVFGLLCCRPEDDHSEKSPIRPGNLIDVQLFITKTASALSVHDVDTQVVLKGKGGDRVLSKTAALVALVRDHGLTEVHARVMLKEAAALAVHNKAATYWVKYADPYTSLQPGPGAPAFPEPQIGSEPLGPYNSVQSLYPQEDHLPVDGVQASMTDPSTYDPFYQPDPQVMQVAQQAAASGQKEVFDTAMISGMLKAVRQDSLVDRYLGDLMKALSNLGRILFMFYWHQEEFEDRYGKSDLPELEDSLRNAFEVLGDVVLFLKEKTVGGGPGALNTSGVGAADAGEPSVQEAARN